MKLFFTIALACISTLLYSQTWKEYADSGQANKQNVDRAIEFYRKAKSTIPKDSLNTYSYATVCENMGLLLWRKKQFEEAESSFLEAIKITKNLYGHQSLEYASKSLTIANFYAAKEEYKTAEPFYVDAMQIVEKVTGKDLDYATLCNKVGAFYRAAKQNDKALIFLEEARYLRVSNLGKQHIDYAESCINLGNVYLDKEDYEKAENLYVEAKDIFELLDKKEDPSYALSCANLGFLYRLKGQYDKAEPLLIAARDLRKKLNRVNSPDFALSCNSLAILYRSMARLEEAEPLFIEAKDTLESLYGKENTDYATACNNLAALYRDMGLFPKAKKLYEEAKEIRRKKFGTNSPDYANSCYNLANLYHNMGHYDEARSLYEEAKAIDEKVYGKTHSDYASSCNGLAALYHDKKEYDKAKDLYLEAKKIQEKLSGKSTPGYASICNGLGIVYEKMGDYKKAEKYYTEAKGVWLEILGEKHPYYAASCANLANLYWAYHKNFKAEEAFKESFAVNSGNLDAIFKFTNEKEKAAFIKNISGEDDKAYSFYVSQKVPSDLPYTLSLFHRNLILSSLQALKQEIFSSNDTALIEKHNSWISMKQYISVLYSTPVSERKSDPALLEEQADLIERDLVRQSSLLKKQQQRVGWRDIQNSLKADEASIEFVSFHYNPAYYGERHSTDSVLYIALVMRKDKALPSLISLFNEKQVKDLLSPKDNKAVNDIINERYTQQPSRNNKKDNAKSIYDLVWMPLENELKGINTVYFAASGVLNNVAFAALPIENEKVLSDKYRLVQLTTTASIPSQTDIFISQIDTLQLYGGIRYDADSATLSKGMKHYFATRSHSRSLPLDLTDNISKWNYLGETASEIAKIDEMGSSLNFKIVSASGYTATEESVKELNGKASPVVLHIATHGFFFPKTRLQNMDSASAMPDKLNLFKMSDDPLFRSGLVFAGANNVWTGNPISGIEDGILTAYEVSNLYLPNTKLAVLSACETGLGDIQGNEGVYGLQRAFKIAGVQNLVMSLWKVPSEETSEFMEEFYKNIFANKSVSDAFYNAQKYMKNKYRNDPYSWAAWILLK